MLSVGKADEKLWEGESLGLYDDLKLNLWDSMINLKLADDQSVLLPNPVF